MEDVKSYSQMRHEFREFYINDVRPKLSEYNTRRKEGAPKIIAAYATFLSLSFVILFGIFSPKLAFISFPIPFICGFVLIYLTRNDAKSNGETVIKTDYEMGLKQTLMRRFVKIFFQDGYWKKSFGTSCNTYTIKDLKNLKDYIAYIRSQKLLNPFPYIFFDDTIKGSFRGVNISIYESNTNIFNKCTSIIILFVITWCTGATNGFFLSFLILLAVIFMWKIFQYSPFRGLIIEFDFNKSFSGHTIFYENSFISKKIPKNKAKLGKVNLESTTFANKYNVYSTNQIEARYILTPAFMERIENLHLAFKAKYVRGSFNNNKLTLAIHTGKDMFAMGSDFRDTDTKTFETLYDEIISVLNIVDELKLNEQTGM